MAIRRPSCSWVVGTFSTFAKDIYDEFPDNTWLWGIGQVFLNFGLIGFFKFGLAEAVTWQPGGWGWTSCTSCVATPPHRWETHARALGEATGRLPKAATWGTWPTEPLGGTVHMYFQEVLMIPTGSWIRRRCGNAERDRETGKGAAWLNSWVTTLFPSPSGFLLLSLWWEPQSLKGPPPSNSCPVWHRCQTDNSDGNR